MSHDATTASVAALDGGCSARCWDRWSWRRVPAATRFRPATGHDRRPAHRACAAAWRTAGTARRSALAAPGRTGRSRPVVDRHELGHRVPGQLRVRRQLQRLQHLRHRQPGRPGAEDVASSAPAARTTCRSTRTCCSCRSSRRPRKKDCTARRRRRPPTTRFRGIRIFDISNIEAPVQVGSVQTCRGSHTHTLVRPKNDPNNVYIYVSGHGRRPRNAAELAGCDGNNANDADGREPVEVADRGHQGAAGRSEHGGDRQRAAAVRRTSDGRASTACRTGRRRRSTRARPRRRTAPAAARSTRRRSNWSPTPITDACHDITVYEEIDLAAGACEGNGLLIDISDPANPKRIDAVADPLFAYWHGATFSNDGKAVLFTDEWGGGNGRSLPRDRPAELGRGRDLRDRQPQARLPQLLQAAGGADDDENCVSHVGNLVPVPGRNIMVQAWYQGGAVADRLHRPDATRRRSATSTAARSTPTAARPLGGFWSTYWYNGRIYGSEIARGFDSFKLTPTADLTAGEIDSAERVRKLERTNAAEPGSVHVWTSAPVPAPVGGTVPATLSLSLGAPAQLRRVHAGRGARRTRRPRPATVTSTAGDALLSVADPSPQNTGPPRQRRVLPAAAAAGAGPQRGQHGHGLQQRRLDGFAVEPAELQRRRSPTTR